MFNWFENLLRVEENLSTLPCCCVSYITEPGPNHNSDRLTNPCDSPHSCTLPPPHETFGKLTLFRLLSDKKTDKGDIAMESVPRHTMGYKLTGPLPWSTESKIIKKIICNASVQKCLFLTEPLSFWYLFVTLNVLPLLMVLAQIKQKKIESNLIKETFISL